MSASACKPYIQIYHTFVHTPADVLFFHSLTFFFYFVNVITLRVSRPRWLTLCKFTSACSWTRQTLPYSVSLSMSDASFSFTRNYNHNKIKQQSPKKLSSLWLVVVVYSLQLCSCYIPSLNSFRVYSFSEALANNIDADWSRTHSSSLSILLLLLRLLLLPLFYLVLFFFVPYICVNSSRAAISFFLQTLSPVACVCVCLYWFAVSTDATAHQNWTWQFSFWLLVHFDSHSASLCVCVCVSVFYCRLFLTSLQTHSTDKYKFISNSVLNILPQHTAVNSVGCLPVIPLLYQIPCILFASSAEWMRMWHISQEKKCANFDMFGNMKKNEIGNNKGNVRAIHLFGLFTAGWRNLRLVYSRLEFLWICLLPTFIRSPLLFLLIRHYFWFEHCTSQHIHLLTTLMANEGLATMERTTNLWS